jgi:hypothetical protein
LCLEAVHRESGDCCDNCGTCENCNGMPFYIVDFGVNVPQLTYYCEVCWEEADPALEALLVQKPDRDAQEWTRSYNA